jgi:hypothetical protein
MAQEISDLVAEELFSANDPDESTETAELIEQSEIPARPVAVKTPPSRRTRVAAELAKRSAILMLGGMFTAGLLLGWLVIGWWLWPIDWTSSAPGQSSLEYQRMFVPWVADRYWQTGDVSQAQQYLAEWKRADLARFIDSLQRETRDVESRRHLVALAEAMRLPSNNSSLLTLIFSQPGIVLGMLLSIIPLIAAVTFVTMPNISVKIGTRIGILKPAREAASIEEFERSGEMPQAEAGLDELITADEPMEQTTEGQQEGEEEKTEEQPAEEAEEQSSGLGDLASLFEEEDTSVNALEAFTKGMAEINIDELFTLGSNIIYQLRHGKLRK